MTWKNQVRHGFGADVTPVLEIRHGSGNELLASVANGGMAAGLHEGTVYQLSCTAPSANLYIDDVLIPPTAIERHSWTPAFFAGFVSVIAEDVTGKVAEFGLHVSPQASKASDEQFVQMVEAIRDFDQTLLAGVASAAMALGKEGHAGLLTANIQLQRLRRYGPMFVEAVSSIVRSPHRSLTAESRMLPLARIRQVHPSVMRDRRVVALATSSRLDGEELDTLQIRSHTSTPTFDTPANRALLALLRRVHARTRLLEGKVQRCELKGDKDEQALRSTRRLAALNQLSERLRALCRMEPFSELSPYVEVTAAGLTQVAANPSYNRTYRLGCLALASGLEGIQKDKVNVNYSWGIYETWCFLAVLQCMRSLGLTLIPTVSALVKSDLAYSASLSKHRSIELHFQPKFPSIEPSKGKVCWSISRERYPDILLVDVNGGDVRSMVLDAKWRSGRTNLLEAMESVHIYHDALRTSGNAPSPCLLLVPGDADVPALAAKSYIESNQVGAVYEFGVEGGGQNQLTQVLQEWVGPFKT